MCLSIVTRALECAHAPVYKGLTHGQQSAGARIPFPHTHTRVCNLHRPRHTPITHPHQTHSPKSPHTFTYSGTPYTNKCDFQNAWGENVSQQGVEASTKPQSPASPPGAAAQPAAPAQLQSPPQAQSSQEDSSGGEGHSGEKTALNSPQCVG